MKRLFVVLVVVFACEKPTEPAKPTMTGHWRSVILDIILSQNGEEFSGSGKRWSTSCTVSGVNQYPKISFSVVIPLNTFLYSGEFVGNDSVKITGTDISTYEYLIRQ